jgi:hypothetical protein
VVDPSRSILPVIPLIIRLSADLEVIGVDAQAIMAAVSHHLIPRSDLSLQNAVDEPVGADLMPPEDHLAGVGGGREDV